MTAPAPRRTWTAGDVLALGVRTSVPVAGEILGGLSRTQSYMAVEHGKFPVPVLRVGRRMVVPVAPILELLHIGSDVGAAGPAPPGPVGRRRWWWYSYRCPECSTYQFGRARDLSAVTGARRAGCGHPVSIVIARTYGSGPPS